MDGECPQLECSAAQVAFDLVSLLLSLVSFVLQLILGLISRILQLLFGLINLIRIAVVAGCRSEDQCNRQRRRRQSST